MEKKKVTEIYQKLFFTKTASMFNWESLPDELTQQDIESNLQKTGSVVAFKHDGKLVVLPYETRIEDSYHNPVKVLVTDAYLKLSKELTIGSDAVLINNDSNGFGLSIFANHYSELLAENAITMLITDYHTRTPYVLSGSDNDTVNSAREYLNKVKDGELGIIASQPFFDGIKVSPTNSGSIHTFSDLFGYHQFLQSELNTLLGIATNNNMKRERLTTNEIEVNKNASYPFIDDMLRCRRDAVDAINDMFDLDITVDYGSIWKEDASEDSSLGGNNDMGDDADDGSSGITDDSDDDESNSPDDKTPEDGEDEKDDKDE